MRDIITYINENFYKNIGMDITSDIEKYLFGYHTDDSVDFFDKKLPTNIIFKVTIGTGGFIYKTIICDRVHKTWTVTTIDQHNRKGKMTCNTTGMISYCNQSQLLYNILKIELLDGKAKQL